MKLSHQSKIGQNLLAADESNHECLPPVSSHGSLLSSFTASIIDLGACAPVGCPLGLTARTVGTKRDPRLDDCYNAFLVE